MEKNSLKEMKTHSRNNGHLQEGQSVKLLFLTL